MRLLYNRKQLAWMIFLISFVKIVYTFCSTIMYHVYTTNNGMNSLKPKHDPLKDETVLQQADVLPTELDRVLLGTRPLVIWSNDYHIAPIADLKHVLKTLNVQFVDKSLSHHCALTRTCASDLRVLTQANGLHLQRHLIPLFYDAYRDDPVMRRVDAFICFHPSAMCELFLPFNKSIIVMATTRYEMGRRDAVRWSQWNEHLKFLAKDPANIIGANNRYDAEYIRYFTGIPAKLLPSYCGYTGVTYSGGRHGYLLAPAQSPGVQAWFFRLFNGAKRRANSTVSLTPLRRKYPRYEYADLAAHQGIVYVPYQVSVMSLFEQYRMNIPLFFPSPDLLADWQYEHHVMRQRTWDLVHGHVPSHSLLPGVLPGVPDPNNERDLHAIRYWLRFSDFYSLPHVTLFDSVDDLVRLMETVDLREVSMRMREHNENFKVELTTRWKRLLYPVKLRALRRTTGMQ